MKNFCGPARPNREFCSAGLMYSWFLIVFLSCGVGIQAAWPLLSMEIRWTNLPVVLSLLPQIAPMFYGFYLLVGRYLVDALQRRQTTYAVTNQRTVILSGFPFFRKIETVFLCDYLKVSFKKRKSGIGTITFSQQRAKSGETAKLVIFGTPPERTIPTLEAIEQAHEVYDIIIRATKEAMAHEPSRRMIEQIAQEQEKTRLTRLADRPFWNISVWYYILIPLATLTGTVGVSGLNGWWIKPDLAVTLIVMLIGYLYGKKPGLTVGIIVFFPGLILHIIGAAALHAAFKGSVLAGRLDMGAFNLRTFGITFLFLAPIGISDCGF